MQTRSQAKSSSAFHSSMPSDPIPIANISKEIIVEENFLSHVPQEVKEEVDLKAEDKSSSIPIDDLVSALRSFGKTSSKPGTIGNLREPEPFTGRDPSQGETLRNSSLFFFSVGCISGVCLNLRMISKESLLPCPISGTWLKSGSNLDFLASPTFILSGLTAGTYLWMNFKTTLGLLTSPPISNMNLPISGWKTPNISPTTLFVSTRWQFAVHGENLLWGIGFTKGFWLNLKMKSAKEMESCKLWLNSERKPRILMPVIGSVTRSTLGNKTSICPLSRKLCHQILLLLLLNLPLK